MNKNLNPQECKIDQDLPEFISHRAPTTLPARLRLMARKSPIGWDLEIRGPVLDAANAIEALEQECFTMAAGQCCVQSGGLMADDHGNTYCDMQRQRDELRGEANVLADILRDAGKVIKTIEGESTEEEESLWQLRYMIDMALSPYDAELLKRT